MRASNGCLRVTASERSAVTRARDEASRLPWIALSEPTRPKAETAIEMFEPSPITYCARVVCRPLSLV
jgi:hypothetical protein